MTAYQDFGSSQEHCFSTDYQFCGFVYRSPGFTGGYDASFDRHADVVAVSYTHLDVYKRQEGSEGRFDNFLFLSRLLLNSTLFCTNLPLSMQF